MKFTIKVGDMVTVEVGEKEKACPDHGTKRPAIAWTLIGIGGVFLVVALAFSLHAWHFTRIAQRTTANVIEMLSQTDKDSGMVTYAPTFKFQAADGSPHTVSSSFYSAPPAFHVGDSVTVLYRSDDPQTARIDSYWQVWGIASLFGIFGSVLLPAGLVVLFWPKITAPFRKRTPVQAAVQPSEEREH